jgi:hypothetical protein
MKKIFVVFSLLALTLTGCENFLDTENLTKQDTSNYPSTPEQVNEMLVGVYRAARAAESGGEFARGALLMGEIMSDDRFGAAGSTSQQDTDLAAYELFQNREEDGFAETWAASYQAIYRANSTLEGIELVEWADADAKAYAQGQALFLRANTFFYLARTFGTVPMPMASEPVNLPRATPEEMFGQIAADLVTAIDLMPETKLVPERGRATRWAAEAVLAKAFLFYTGYYGKESIAMPGEAGELTKAQVIEYVDDCVNNSGHSLLPHFESLWPYSNPITRANGGYKWLDAKDPDKEIVWAGEEGGNVETLFAWQFGTTGTEDRNTVNLFFGIRMIDYSDAADRQTERTFPFGSGWGFGTVSTNMWNDWPDSDPRKKASIMDVNDPLEATGYVRGADSWQMETGFFQKKYMPILAQDDAVGSVTGVANGRVNYTRWMYPSITNIGYAENNSQDVVVMRFADVLLMQAELKEDAAPMNLVRARVGLEPIAYSTENLRNERRWELAFEGVRYFDLLRYGLDYAGAALNKQNGVAITNSSSGEGDGGVPAVMNLGDQAAGVKATGGFLPLPLSEINKSGGVLTQTPGWAIQ